MNLIKIKNLFEYFYDKYEKLTNDEKESFIDSFEETICVIYETLKKPFELDKATKVELILLLEDLNDGIKEFSNDKNQLIIEKIQFERDYLNTIKAKRKFY